MLLASELQSLLSFGTEIRAAAAAVVVVVVEVEVVLAQCKRAKDSCSLHSVRASLTPISSEGDITISEGAARGTITPQQCKSHAGKS